MTNRTRKLSGARAFTLVELLIAIVAGMMVAAAAFAFSKSSTRFFAREARIATAQMSVISGFQRLQSEIARAGYLASPNMPRDVAADRICAPDIATYKTWPIAMQGLSGLKITQGSASTVAPAPNTNPDSIRLLGSYAATDQFPVNAIARGTSGYDIYLASNNGSMTRSGLVTGADMQNVFKPGRLLRITDLQGKQAWGVIRVAAFNTSGQAIVSTTSDMELPIKGETSTTCGIGGNGTGAQVSVVSIIEYGIGSMKALGGGNSAVYDKTIYDEAGAAYGDTSRTELIRREILLDGVDQARTAVIPPFAPTQNAEIIAEYAVDLRFGLWVGGAEAATTVGLQYIPPTSTGVTTRTTPAGVEAVENAIGSVPTGPESVRAVEVRLVVRSREVDQGVDLDTALVNSPTAVTGGYIFRYRLPNGEGYARARTLVANVALQNQRGESW